MSELGNVNYHTLPIGAFSGATEVPIGFNAAQYGGVTVLEAWLVSNGAGTAIGGMLVTMGAVATGGTPAINGTVGSFAGTIVTAAGVVHKLTISDPWVQQGELYGYDQTSGTIPAGSSIVIAVIAGRGAS